MGDWCRKGSYLAGQPRRNITDDRQPTVGDRVLGEVPRWKKDTLFGLRVNQNKSLKPFSNHVLGNVIGKQDT
jgi:hypothetical protein